MNTCEVCEGEGILRELGVAGMDGKEPNRWYRGYFCDGCAMLVTSRLRGIRSADSYEFVRREVADARMNLL